MSDITLKAMPFDSNEILDSATGETTFDRVAYSRDLADWLRTYISNGILVQGGNVLGSQLQVMHKEALTCSVKTGAVCINGRTGWLEADTDITVEMGGAQPRVDRVVAELNIPNDRGVYIKVLKGVPAAVPVPPELTQTEDVYQIPLAKIRVTAGSAVIGEVLDERQDYISNVTIGIKPPTGMDASTITLPPSVLALYGLPLTARLSDTLTKTIQISSYLALCGNLNIDLVNAALGKENHNMIHNMGLQLAMYAWFKGENKITYPFTDLCTKDTLQDMANDYECLQSNAFLINFILDNAYARSFFEPFDLVTATANLNRNTFPNWSTLTNSSTGMAAILSVPLACKALANAPEGLNYIAKSNISKTAIFANMANFNAVGSIMDAALSNAPEWFNKQSHSSSMSGGTAVTRGSNLSLVYIDQIKDSDNGYAFSYARHGYNNSNLSITLPTPSQTATLDPNIFAIGGLLLGSTFATPNLSYVANVYEPI